MKNAINLIFLVAALFLAGCNTPKQEEFFGKWIPENNSPGIVGNMVIEKQPFFILRNDGTFVMKDMPNMLLYGFSSQSDIVSGEGKWVVGKYSRASVLFLEFEKVNNANVTSATQVQISGCEKKRNLYFWLGEEGGPRFEFKKEE